MSMIPASEDFERLAVRWVSSPAAKNYPSLVAMVSAFPELYAKDRDALPQTDADRAFALAGRAAQIFDHQVVDAKTQEDADRSTVEATAMVDEALKLDPKCHDALRIRRNLQRPTRQEMLEFLQDNAETVLAECEAQARQAGVVPPEGHMGCSPYLKPYLRWLFDIANEQLGLGRYRASLEACDKALELDREDVAGLRQIAALDYVKLEDDEGLARLRAQYPDDNNAWFELSELFLAYKRRDFEAAEAKLQDILRTYPAPGMTLAYQEELPAGLFSHLEYAEGSDDELFVAVSEAAVILDENCGDFASPLSSWIATHPDVEAARVLEESRAQQAAQQGDQQEGGEQSC